MKISQLHPNEGQINGVPNNPRKITEKELKKLKESIKRSPEFLSARPLIVNDKWEILGGNMRFRALCLLRDEGVIKDEIPEDWVRVVNWTRRKQREFVLKDNASSGSNDLELLKKWDISELSEWGVIEDMEAAVPDFGGGDKSSEQGDEQKPSNAVAVNFEPQAHKKRASLWKKASTSATDLREDVTFHHLSGGGFLSSFAKSDDGYELADIKKHENGFVEMFAQAAYRALKCAITITSPQNMCIITTPSRRHKDWNFAAAVCERLSELTGARFERGAIEAKNATRLEPTFYRIKTPAEPILILYDDILTTGSTIKAARALYEDKAIITIIGVLNR